MLYFPREPSAYYVRVTVRQDTGEWTRRQLRKRELLSAPSGLHVLEALFCL
jgi:hypothetical protein